MLLKKNVSYMIPVDKSISFFLKTKTKIFTQLETLISNGNWHTVQKLLQNVNNTVKWKKLVKVDNLISEKILLSKVHRSFPNHLTDKEWENLPPNTDFGI